jgi:hypothetical protein
VTDDVPLGAVHGPLNETLELPGSTANPALHVMLTAGRVPLVLDLRIDHDRFGSSSDPTLNGTLHYPNPNDIDRSLNEAVVDKIRKYL